MIKATDLRVGNLVNTPHGIGQIKSIFTQGCWVNFKNQSIAFSCEEIEPIPITEELLIKAGFKVRESSTCKQFYIGKNPITHDWLFDLVWLEKPELIDYPNVPFYRNGHHAIHFVHQLQNLYHALTGEELIFEGLN